MYTLEAVNFETCQRVIHETAQTCRANTAIVRHSLWSVQQFAEVQLYGYVETLWDWSTRCLRCTRSVFQEQHLLIYNFMEFLLVGKPICSGLRIFVSLALVAHHVISYAHISMSSLRQVGLSAWC